MSSSPTPFWRPDIHADRRPALLARGRIKAALRRWFEARGFTEVEAAVLQRSPGNETHLHGFATTLIDNAAAPHPYYLHTSPEFAAKKLLAAGEERIFDFARVFRNRERTALHHPEFTMLEWYRVGADYEVLMRDAAALMAEAARAAGIATLRWRGSEADPFAEPERLTLHEAFVRHAGIDLLSTVSPDGATDRAALAAQAVAAGLRLAEDDSWSDIFSRVLSERIEPQLAAVHGDTAEHANERMMVMQGIDLAVLEEGEQLRLAGGGARCRGRKVIPDEGRVTAAGENAHRLAGERARRRLDQRRPAADEAGRLALDAVAAEHAQPPRQLRRRHRPHHIDAEHAPIDCLGIGNMPLAQHIVGDGDGRRLAPVGPLAGADLGVEHRRPRQGQPHRPEARQHLAPTAVIAEPVADPHQPRMQPYRELVHEWPAIGRGDVDRTDLPTGQRAERRFQLQRHAQRAGEQVHRARRKHRQRHPVGKADAGRRRDGAVAASGQQHIGGRIGRGAANARRPSSPW